MEIDKIDVNREVRIVFMGTPEIAVPILTGLLEHYKFKGVVTQMYKPVGRK